jgi:hypothetical protein
VVPQPVGTVVLIFLAEGCVSLSFGDFSLGKQRKVTRSLPPEQKQNFRTNRLRNLHKDISNSLSVD